ncbi:SsrA-binding protein [Helicobacter pylori]|uniref:SsrA-binding protein n=1 Tax=Helicobacter pylori TaxID=210 RepID=UPI000EB17480|nr:SsrA-binding protein [Helicobacter pylori]
MDFTEFDLHAFPAALTHHISGVTLHTSCPRYKLWGYYNKLAVFIPIAKDV